MPRRLFASMFAVLTALTCQWTSALCQNCATWNQVAAIDPGDRAEGGFMAYDSQRDVTVLFGGGNNDNQTWEWDGSQWSQRLVPNPKPPSRSTHAMAYDSARGVTVLFGGANLGSSADDTWEWNGATWTLKSTFGPSGRYGHAMAYDQARQKLVLFGGAGAGFLNDTWIWDGSFWIQVANTGPQVRYGHAMVYDSARQRIVLFGGSDGSLFFRDTWEWDGQTWEQRATTGPAGRRAPAMAYDPVRGKTVLVGGYNSCEAMLDTWEWNGTVWESQSASGPAARFGHAMVFDTARNLTLMYGSSNLPSQFWTLSAISPPSVIEHPGSLSASEGQTAMLDIAVSGAGPISFQWRRDGVHLSNGGRISGATSVALQIVGLVPSDFGAYDVTASNSCGVVVSHPAALMVTPACGSPDFDGDGDIGTDLDIEAFFRVLGGGPC